MNRSPSALALLLPMVAACAGAPPAEQPPPGQASDINILEVATASPLAAIFVTDTVSIDGALDPQKTRDAFATQRDKLVACFRVSLERDQALAGELAYAFSVEPSGKLLLLQAEGSLSGLPEAKCGALALQSIALPAEASSSKIRYQLVFAGKYRRESRSAAQLEALGWADVDAVDMGSGATDAKATEALLALRNELVLCLDRDDKSTKPKAWQVALADKTGALKLAAQEGPEQPAAYCLRSKLERLKLPPSPAGIAISVALDGRPRPGGDAPNAPGIFGDQGGDAFGAGGLGMSGTGLGGGGTGSGSIGLGNTRPSTLGGGTPSLGGGGAPAGPPARRPPAPPKAPSLRIDKAAVRGSMDEQIISRIVRQNLGRFRYCYEKALQSKPAARGRIETTFTIDSLGDVATPKSSSTNFTDSEMLACVQRTFMRFSFPAPADGIVVVRFPIMFAPPGAPAPEPTNNAPALPEPTPQPKTIAGDTFDKLDGPSFRDKLGRASREARLVPVATLPAPPIAFTREENGAIAVVTRVPGAVKSACAISDAGFSVLVQASDENTCKLILRELLDRAP